MPASPVNNHVACAGIVREQLSGIEKPSPHQPPRPTHLAKLGAGPFAVSLVSAVSTAAAGGLGAAGVEECAVEEREMSRGGARANLLTSAKAAAWGSARHSAQMDVPPADRTREGQGVCLLQIGNKRVPETCTAGLQGYRAYQKALVRGSAVLPIQYQRVD